MKRTMRSYAYMYWILFVLFVLQRTPKSSTAAKAEDAPLIYKQKRVQFFDHAGLAKRKRKTRWEPISNSRRAEYPSTISTSRRACGFYLWNAVSASMYHLCTYLMRDAVFEGKGGRKVCGVLPVLARGYILLSLFGCCRHVRTCSPVLATVASQQFSLHLLSLFGLNLDLC